MKSSERLKRFSILREVAQQLPIKNLDMGVWRRDDACGTVCCLAGWAAHHPELQKMGLSLIPLSIIYPQSDDSDPCYSIATEDGATGFEALEDFFGINEDEASFLFDISTYHYAHETGVSKHEILRRIDYVVGGYKP